MMPVQCRPKIIKRRSDFCPLVKQNKVNVSTTLFLIRYFHIPDQRSSEALLLTYHCTHIKHIMTVRSLEHRSIISTNHLIVVVRPLFTVERIIIMKLNINCKVINDWASLVYNNFEWSKA